MPCHCVQKSREESDLIKQECLSRIGIALGTLIALLGIWFSPAVATVGVLTLLGCTYFLQGSLLKQLELSRTRTPCTRSDAYEN